MPPALAMSFKVISFSFSFVGSQVFENAMPTTGTLIPIAATSATAAGPLGKSSVSGSPPPSSGSPPAQVGCPSVASRMYLLLVARERRQVERGLAERGRDRRPVPEAEVVGRVLATTWIASSAAVIGPALFSAGSIVRRRA